MKFTTWVQSQKWQDDLFVSKASHSIVIQVYAPNSNAEEDERFYENLHDWATSQQKYVLGDHLFNPCSVEERSENGGLKSQFAYLLAE